MDEKKVNKIEKGFFVVLILFITTIIATIVVLSPNENMQAKDTNAQLNSQIASVANFTRKAAVAGQFYSNSKETLDTELQSYLNSAEKIQSNGKLRILVVPHAGIKYSGKTSAVGFKQLERQQYNKIIILGVSHSTPINYAAVLNKGEWETPLGNLKIDEELASRIINQQTIRVNEGAHANEHSIELEGIFIKKVFGEQDISILPILIGQADDNLIETLAYKLASIIDDKTLIIVSTDLAHYPNENDAKKIDANTINGIVSGQKNAFEKAVRENTAGKYENLLTSACGYEALRVALKLSEILQINEIKMLDYSNSADTAGDPSRVVGYTATGFYSKEIKPILLSNEAKKAALKLARETLTSLYKKTAVDTPRNSELNLPIGAFTTLTKNGDLRGCIGLFEPDKSLSDVIKYVTTAAATQDPRFTPVVESELGEIEIELSTMTPLQLISYWHNIILGKHGVKIVLGNKTGTLLPQVATDNNWDLTTFLETICDQKAGLAPDCYKNPETKIYTFETEIFSEKDFTN